ncbi:MAG: NAD+ synthase [Nitrospirota bacterium]|nr:NAD+ synthase [Nitrospirota bacterium]MDH5768608.1 NAD+ synthase [Nitrospirota bacterium]
MKTLRLALAQINPTVGDFEDNVSKIINYIEEASKDGVQVVAFPELAITGYPPEDLLLKPQFIEDNLDALKKVQENVGDITAIVGFVDRNDDIYNAAAIMYNKTLIDTYHKMYLPNYGVFDEYRYFQAGTRCPLYKVGDTWVGVNICEDIWYPEGPTRLQALAGAELIININASPYRIGRGKSRENMLSVRAFDSMVNVAYLNTVGGQDELVFDGHSIVIDESGTVIARGKQFEEDLIVIDLNLEAVIMRRLHAPRRRKEVIKLGKEAVDKITIPVEKTSYEKRKMSRLHLSSLEYPVLEPLEEIYRALVLGTSDYVFKNGFKGVMVSLSGGIDSSIVASIAVDALGKENVTGLFMPSPYTSKESREDVYALRDNLGIKVREVPIDNIFKTYLGALKQEFQGLTENTTEENIQARIRGNILMAFSNKFGWLVLTTGNKSELSVGYATLYGDMAGGFAVIKDVPKTMIYELCKWKNNNEGRTVIPERVLQKEPSAELRPDQRDTDTLPPYHMLDPILKAYIEDDKSFEEILSLGCEVECVQNVIRMIDKSEYKRRQAPPGIKITQRAFGRDRRFPITNKYRGH